MGLVHWSCLLRDFWNFYRFTSAGGSKPIRSHQHEVRNRLSAVLKTGLVIEERTASQLPVCAWLDRAIDRGLDGPGSPIVKALRHVTDQLEWELGYEKIPAGLKSKFGYAELAGPRGPVLSDHLTLGLVLFAPGCVYPAHSHDGISESYICLSGVVSDKDAGVYSPGSLLYNPPQKSHRLTTGDHEPTLLAYAWVGPDEQLHNQKLHFSRPPREG